MMSLMGLMGLWVDRELFILLKMSIIVTKGYLAIYRGLLHMWIYHFQEL